MSEAKSGVLAVGEPIMLRFEVLPMPEGAGHQPCGNCGGDARHWLKNGHLKTLFICNMCLSWVRMTDPPWDKASWELNARKYRVERFVRTVVWRAPWRLLQDELRKRVYRWGKWASHARELVDTLGAMYRESGATQEREDGGHSE